MSAHRELDAFARRERLRLIRDWSFGIGLVACTAALFVIGSGAVGNPKAWASAYHALSAAGGLRWLALPLLGVGVALLVTAIVTAILGRKH